MRSAPGDPSTDASEPRPGEPWTVLRMILWSARWLEERGIESARLDAEHLLAHAVGVGRLQLYLDFERPLTRDELDEYRPLLKRRGAREPLQYIVGRQPFRELDLEVGPGVLVPRPETEVLVDRVLEAWSAEGRSGGRVLDVGTGSGAIALALAFEGSFASVVATDVEEVALERARRNRDAAGLEGRVELRLGSLFDPLGADERFDVIVSNPPYVADSDAASLEPEVLEWEPRRALFAGADGTEVLFAIVDGARPRLEDGGLLALEVGLGQAGAVAGRLAASGQWTDTAVLRDYTGRERFVFARGA